MGLKISELVQALSKVQSAIGDAPVVFKELEGDAETALRSIGIELGPDGNATSSTVTLNHGEPQPEPEPAEPPAEQTNAPSDQAASAEHPIS